MIVGTSTNCSAVCTTGTLLRRQRRDEDEILGTSIACSGMCKSRCRHASTSWSTPCGPGMSRIYTMGTTSANCSTVRCWTRSCGSRGSPRQGGREPLSASSSSNSWKNAWGGGASVAVARRTPHAPPLPWPLPLSDLVRCGAWTRQGKWRSTAARASRQRAVVALFAAEGHWRLQHPS